MASNIQEFRGLTLLQLRWVRQVILFVALAAAVAIGVVVALWTTEPNFTPLYSELSGRDASAVSEALKASQIPFKIDPRTGTLLVASDKARDARMQLAAQGLPQSDRAGFEMLNEEQGLGTSQFIETARYRHALEAELARSIGTLRGVESARVHLALPKQSVFIRKRDAPRASVLLKLFQGRTLDATQVNAIVHMVASSVPSLEAGNVTLVDHMGRLLSQPDSDQPMAISAKQLEYSRNIEGELTDRIVHLLEPIIGVGKVRAEVNAELDFTRVESTEESYDPNRRTIRSEQINSQQSTGSAPIAGIPGALSNQPPGTGTTNPDASSEEGGSNIPSAQTSSQTRNYEVDRRISHTRQPTGAIVRLSAAVVIDERVTFSRSGKEKDEPYTDEEKTRFTAIIQQAIGFNQARGDTLNLTSSKFVRPEIEALEEASFLDEPWVWDLGKQILGGVFVLALLLFFVRPVVRTLSQPIQLLGPPETAPNPQIATQQSFAALQAQDNSYEEKVSSARNLVKENPDRVASLVKTWVGTDA